MGPSRFVRRVWVGARNRRSLGQVQITFYPPDPRASLVLSPALSGLPWGEWQWVYLQHLSECLATMEDEHEASRLLVAARTLAEDFVTTCEWPRPLHQGVAGSIAGVAQIIPKQPGGTSIVINVVRQGLEIPRVELEWSMPQARERLASSNLVLLVHVMRTATHPLARYELCRKIGLFTEFCQRAGRRPDRETLRAAPIFALVHADIADIARSVGGERRNESEPRAPEAGPARSLPALPVPVRRSRLPLPSIARLGRMRWDRPSVTVAAAACLWIGLIASAMFIPRSGPPPAQEPAVSQPAATPPSPPPGRPGAPREERPVRADAPHPEVAGGASAPGALAAPRPVHRSTAARRGAGVVAALPADRTSQPPVARFRVVSGMLAREVAQLRSESLAAEGIDAFVHMIAGNVAQLQYGAYRSRETAEADAQRIRAQGYTAVVVRW